MSARENDNVTFDGFEKITKAGCTALVRESGAAAIAAALCEGAGCVPAGEGGRGSIQRFACAGGAGILRGYRRGGVARHFLKDAYVLANRPLREFRIHRYAEINALPVPELLGVCWRRGGLLVRGAIATRELSARTLHAYLAETPADAAAVLTACGALIRRMHDLGIWHADLQIKNILVGDGGPWLIDFDNARLRAHLSPLQRARNLLRLRRSLEKNGHSLHYFAPLCAGYGVEALPEWLDRIYAGKGRFSDRMAGRP
jgi:3-deoxy-D-manno-octulosonic acid kinase